MENSMKVNAGPILLVLSKVFDCLTNMLLFYMLNPYGISYEACNRECNHIKSYLCQGLQRVKVAWQETNGKYYIMAGHAIVVVKDITLLFYHGNAVILTLW